MYICVYLYVYICIYSYTATALVPLPVAGVSQLNTDRTGGADCDEEGGANEL